MKHRCKWAQDLFEDGRVTRLTIEVNQPLSKIHKEIYGHFSEHLGRCIYGGIYVGEDSPIPNVNGMRCDVVEALRQIRVPVLRWPGGCFADEYHWRDGIGPRENRKKMINTHWGGVVEDNSFGTHEYFELCRQLGCETYVNGNLGSATEFDVTCYYKTLVKALYMDELVRRHGAIMDEYDPDKRIGMIVDEWDTWYTVEPGTNPGFLYQQNTMRDALVAAVTLNIFNAHSDRVRMANLAQMVNVLQAVLLTEGEQMVKTPTYHVFDLYKHHQDATMLQSSLETEQIGAGEWQVPALHQSASVDGEGVVHLTLANLSAHESSQAVKRPASQRNGGICI